MGAGAIRQGYVANHFEEMMMGRVGKLTRQDMKNVQLFGSGWPIVYICSPFAAYGQNTVQTNITEARRYCRYAIGQKKQPIAVHLLYPQFLDDRNEREREMGLAFGLSILQKCDIESLWVFKGRGGIISDGMQREIALAERLHIPVVFIEDPEAYGMYGWNPIAEYDSNHGKEGADGSISGHGHGKPGAEPGERDHPTGGDGLSEGKEVPAGEPKKRRARGKGGGK